jgi:mannose-6-phosphate isomerase-like protein (cupin superfamily)
MHTERRIDSIERDAYDLIESLFSNPIKLNLKVSYRGFNVENEAIKVTRLYECGDLVIVHASFKKNAIYPYHPHTNSAEHFVCVHGKLQVNIKQSNLVGDLETISKTLEPTECMTIPIGLEHSVTALEQSEVVAICIPPEMAYCSKKEA